MQKAAIQISVAALVVFGIWFGLSRVDWMKVLHVKKATDTTEEKLGEVVWEVLRANETEIHSKMVNQSIDSLVSHLCKANDIDRDKIKVHVFRNSEINAFALPDNYLVVYSGLIVNAENEAELLGVLGHEIAHMQKKHVMKKLAKEIGLSALISISSGGKGGEAATGLLKTLSSTAYDRDLEREADITSVDYMEKAGIDPEPFANFLYRLSDEEKDIPNQLYWISTHPESKERAEDIINYMQQGKKRQKKTILSPQQWEKFKEKLKDEG